ncbi:biliverdin-producing heme oxygenase [Mesorhizobium microcysteis]|uniref:Biliverdin-producing heme oxygenase n=1 Tax=Neoaquamicrobium microcysteis TaxID=2682781 RepID=A0A5D4GWQ2_9HYPH|nr:biliverdin-producing heme oxygenase [Mesorhizobium microcysteis]TYR32727.1 biliverdin-producing heme oxygenase [Mesorhizobium microcysteis]
MNDVSLRSALRAHTSHIHEQLDAATPAFADKTAYVDFLSKTLRFRAAMELVLARCPIWEPDTLVVDLERDLVDLGVARRDANAEPPHFSGLSAQLGALYVVEGASVGARVLFARAAALGMSESFGARALARQAQDRQRWKRFVSVLDEAQGVDFEAAKSAAQRAFEFAYRIYSEPVFESA